MHTNINIIIYSMYGLLALNLIFAIAIYGIKLRNIRRCSIHEHFNLRCKDFLIYIQANLDSDERLRVPPFRMKKMEMRALQERLNDMIESFAGEQRFRLIDLCKQLGFIQFHLRRLHARSYGRKLDAAYHLGCMRIKEAVPALLELLRHHRLDSTLFVIARAIAKCSRDENDVKEMVRILLTHNKSFPDLLVDIIEEAEIDRTALFEEFIHHDHPAVIHVGLTGLEKHSNPGIAGAVYQLIDSSDKDIQRKAIETYLKSSSFLPRNVVTKFIEHPNAEIRLLTVQALSELNYSFYADIMQKCLKDRDRRVIYAAAIGLIRLGQEGIPLFCQVAKDSLDNGHGTFLQDIIREEITALSMRLDSLSTLTRYNDLLYIYEKTFGKNKRIYRVI